MENTEQMSLGRHGRWVAGPGWLMPWLLALAVSCSSFSWADHRRQANAQDALPNSDTRKAATIGQFLTLSGSIDDAVIARLKRIGLALQKRSHEEHRRAVLVLEITPGVSQFHNVQGLARFLATGLATIKTVAWIPEDVTGHNVVVALACNDIVMNPDAVLGDISLGSVLDRDEQSFVVNLVHRRRNRKLSEALVLGMLDRQQEVLQVTIQIGAAPGEATETRVMLPAEFDRLLKQKTVILEQRTLKNAGRVGAFSGSEARDNNFLVASTAGSRADVADLYQLPREAMRESPSAGAAPIVKLIKIDGVIEPVLEGFVIRQIDWAVASGVNLLIFEIDSPGGHLLSSESIAYAIAELDPKKVRTIAYIPKMALSGAAIVSLGCDEIIMHPDAKFGDAGAIWDVKGDGQFQYVPDKLLSAEQETLKDLAKKNNRPPALALAMMFKKTKVYQVTHHDSGKIWYMTEDEIHESNGEWIKGRLIFPEMGKELFLTVNGERAHTLKLAEPPVSSKDELKQRLGIAPNVPLDAVGRTWVDTLIYVLNSPSVSVLLIILGIFLIYIELHLTTGVFGIGAGVCFALFFWSRYLGGTAGWLEAVLFIAGLVCLGVEIFVVPGFGVFGVSGSLLIIASLILASQTFVIPHSEADYRVLARSVGSLSLAIVGVTFLAVAINRYLPKMPLLNQMILTPPGVAGGDFDEPRLAPQYASQTTGGQDDATPSLLGALGIAVTVLRPAGKAQIEDQFVDVVSDGPYIEQGTTIKVIEAAGNRIVVRQV